MSENEIVKQTINYGFMNPKTMQEAKDLANDIKDEALLPDHYRGKPGAIIICAQISQELDIPLMQGLQGIAVINGRPGVYGDLMLAICRRSQPWEYFEESLDEATMTASCTVKRRHEPALTRTFSKKDAEMAGLWGGKDNWKKYPNRMLQHRARSFALRDCYTDVLHGLYLMDELNEGAIIDVIDCTDVTNKPGSPEVVQVTEQQLTALKEKIKAAQTDETKMCAVLKIDTLDSMTIEQFNVITNIVDKRLEKIAAATATDKKEESVKADNTVA